VRRKKIPAASSGFKLERGLAIQQSLCSESEGQIHEYTCENKKQMTSAHIESERKVIVGVC